MLLAATASRQGRQGKCRPCLFAVAGDRTQEARCGKPATQQPSAADMSVRQQGTQPQVLVASGCQWLLVAGGFTALQFVMIPVSGTRSSTRGQSLVQQGRQLGVYAGGIFTELCLLTACFSGHVCPVHCCTCSVLCLTACLKTIGSVFQYQAVPGPAGQTAGYARRQPGLPWGPPWWPPASQGRRPPHRRC